MFKNINNAISRYIGKYYELDKRCSSRDSFSCKRRCRLCMMSVLYFINDVMHSYSKFWDGYDPFFHAVIVWLVANKQLKSTHQIFIIRCPISKTLLKYRFLTMVCFLLYVWLCMQYCVSFLILILILIFILVDMGWSSGSDES